MSDNIPPFDIQMEIIKKVSSVKSLIQFRSVSKQWKSFIESSEFIKGYGSRHTHPHSHILSYTPGSFMDFLDPKYICLVDDDVETLKVQQQDLAPFVVSPLIKQCRIISVIGACHGLLCLLADIERINMLVIWNPSIGKSFGIALPRFYLRTSYGFGVCPDTSDPTVVKFVCTDNMPWHVEVFTLSSGVWNVIPSANLPFQSQTVRFKMSSHAVIDEFIYWCAWERTNIDHGENHMVVSFDLITKEFNVVNLPDGLKKVPLTVSVSKLRGSLVLCVFIPPEEASVWVMENDSSFTKLFTIGAPFYLNQILRFKKTGEIVYTTRNRAAFRSEVLDVYDPCSQQIKNLGISGARYSFFMGSYKESLLLLDHLDSHIYYHNN